MFRFKLIVKPIANACIREEQKDYVDFELIHISFVIRAAMEWDLIL